MNIKLRLLLIAAGVLLIIFSIVGFLGQNFNLGETSPEEIYADNFASILLLATIITGVSTIFVATRIKKISILGAITFFTIVAIKNPWAYHGIRVGFIDNPWSNPALITLIMASAAINILVLFLVLNRRKA